MIGKKLFAMLQNEIEELKNQFAKQQFMFEITEE